MISVFAVKSTYRTGKSTLRIDNSSEQPAVHFIAHRNVRDRTAYQGNQPGLKAELDRGLGSWPCARTAVYVYVHAASLSQSCTQYRDDDGDRRTKPIRLEKRTMEMETNQDGELFVDFSNDGLQSSACKAMKNRLKTH